MMYKFAAAAAGVALAGAAQGQVVYSALLESLNDSGVQGGVTLVQSGSQLTVTLYAFGLVPNEPHITNITGFPSGLDAVVPGSSYDTDEDGFISLNEGLLAFGGNFLSLTQLDGTYPAATNGFISYTRVFDLTPQQLANLGASLEDNAVVIQGGFADLDGDGTAEYSASLPVAAGELVLVIPTPGVLALAGVGGLVAVRRRR